MKHALKVLFVFIFVFFCLTMTTYAAAKKVILSTSVNIRRGPGTNYGVIAVGAKNTVYDLKRETVLPDEPKNGDCNSGWYEIDYRGSKAYVCAGVSEIKNASDIEIEEDIYYRPWTTPKLAITGGAKFLSREYISRGQFTSYLKKFNVNPNSDYSLYNHQYMANLAAPKAEANKSYESYSENGLLKLPLEFTIPIYNSMPDYTTLPGLSTDKSCQSKVTDAVFENKLNAEGFPESYKCKLRALHKIHPNWVFKSLKTNLNFKTSVEKEQKVSSIQGGDKYYDFSTGNKVQTEPGWYKANYATAAYYLDPRNFLNERYILMFEDLAYSSRYTTQTVQTILNGTFMSGKSVLDNQSYASIFVEAGKKEKVSAVYLAALARQESGTGISRTTSGAQFTYKGITYSGLYNFFNIGAYGSESNPALAGLVWASNGSDVVKVSGSSPSSSKESDIVKKLGVKKNSNYLYNFQVGTTIEKTKNSLKGYTVSISGNKKDNLKTGQQITISDGKNNYKYTIVVSGDVDGDGKLGATDYVKIKNYIMEKKGSSLNKAQSLAADVDNNGSIGATDYVKIKKSIMR